MHICIDADDITVFTAVVMFALCLFLITGISPKKL